MVANEHILDQAVWASLAGPHQYIAEVQGRARRYPVDVSPFGAVEDQSDRHCWEDLSSLIGPGGRVVLTGREVNVPPDWEVLGGGHGKQMTGENLTTKFDADCLELQADDVEEMLDLISRTEPGPFLPRTIELGGYLGIRSEGKLVAMAGRRLHPMGWVEISAVCTDPQFRRRGFADKLVRAVGAGIRADGAIPFLHVSATNENAINLYLKMGFKVRMEGTFRAVKAPK